MKLIQRFVLVLALMTLTAPLIGLADNPLPTCWPCGNIK